MLCPRDHAGGVGSCFPLSSSPGCRLKHVPVDITAHRLIHLKLFSIVSIWFERHQMNEFLQNEFQIGKTVICIHPEITEVLSVAENDSGRFLWGRPVRHNCLCLAAEVVDLRSCKYQTRLGVRWRAAVFRPWTSSSLLSVCENRASGQGGEGVWQIQSVILTAGLEELTLFTSSLSNQVQCCVHVPLCTQ